MDNTYRVTYADDQHKSLFGDITGLSAEIPALNECERKRFLSRLHGLTPLNNSVFVRACGKAPDGGPIPTVMLLQAFYDGDHRLAWVDMTGWIDAGREMLCLKSGQGDNILTRNKA